MDSDCRLLVEEMWQSYLCEENLKSSFYESPPVGLCLNNPQSGTEALLQEDMDLVNEVLDVQDGWEPLEDFFGLMEEMLHENQDEEYNLCGQSNDHQETVKETNICKNTTENVNLTVHDQSEIMSSNHGTSKPKKSKRKKSKKISAQGGKQKKKTKTANK